MRSFLFLSFNRRISGVEQTGNAFGTLKRNRAGWDATELFFVGQRDSLVFNIDKIRRRTIPDSYTEHRPALPFFDTRVFQAGFGCYNNLPVLRIGFFRTANRGNGGLAVVLGFAICMIISSVVTRSSSPRVRGQSR